MVIASFFPIDGDEEVGCGVRGQPLRARCVSVEHALRPALDVVSAQTTRRTKSPATSCEHRSAKSRLLSAAAGKRRAGAGYLDASALLAFCSG
jgi:hypothetical protein